MPDVIETEKINQDYKINFSERSEIENKIDFEIVNGHYKMLTLGAIANIIGGFFYVFVIYNHNNARIVIFWYSMLCLASIADIVWAWFYQTPNLTLQELKNWRKGFLVIVTLLCLTWGSIGILFFAASTQESVITTTFLLAVLICFGFSSVTDFTVAAISICCILLPTILFTILSGINYFIKLGYDFSASISISLAFSVLGIFLLVASYFGHTIVRKFFRLSFENILFSQKLENMNKILEQKVKERTIELENSLTLVNFQATHDLLTELPNNRSLLICVEQAIETATRNKNMFAVACFSLNGMQLINDGLGQTVVDILIKRIAQRFKNIFIHNKNNNYPDTQYTITMSRRDDFVIVIQPIKNENDAEAKASAMLSILNEPISVTNQILTLTASIGVSVYPKDGGDVNTLIMNAGAARILATQTGGNSLSVYQEKHRENLCRQIDMENQLPNALQNKEFILQYQPIVNLHTGTICSAEALIRWVNPKLGSLSPDQFIHIIEANGMIIPIGAWVLQTACKQAVLWHKKGFPEMGISINLSYKQLQQKDVVNVFMEILAQTKINPQYVEFELLERQAFQSEAIPIINQMKSLGISLSIDDFGTGYSALSSLKLFEINKIKIDKSFIQDVETSSDSRNIVINTIALAKSLNASVVAEGVETAEQLKFLKENGCDMIQGYYFSPPVTAKTFLGLLKNQRTLILPKSQSIRTKV